jgi:hypothetical protein
MVWRVFVGLSLIAMARGATADYADYVFVPPTATSGKALEAAMAPVPAPTLAAWLAHPRPAKTYDTYQGQSDALAAEAGRSPLAAKGIETKLDAYKLFDAGFVEQGEHVRTAAITSRDATGLRLLVDLSGFEPGQRLYEIDPAGPRAYGPFTVADALDAGRWLPTVHGDTVVLALVSSGEALPPLYIQGLSHFFGPLQKTLAANYACPIPVECESGTAFQQVSTGIAMLYIPAGNYGHYECTGWLMNVPSAADHGLLMVTANHCVEDTTDATQIDVIWDFRASDCAETVVPNTNDLPHSAGDKILAQDAYVDGALFSLASVPIGKSGRAWLGWDTRAPIKSEPVATIQHPLHTAMKLAYGHVARTGVGLCLDFLCTRPVGLQTEVIWDQGITASGSSGAPMLYNDGLYRAGGMLSNGPKDEACGNTSDNYDDFASFATFFNQIRCYINPADTCGAATTAPSGICAFASIFGKNSDAAKNLRSFRDNALESWAGGRRIAQAYYALAPWLNSAVDRSAAFRDGVALAAQPFIALGRMLR